tara:strand:- start:207 stop:2324 length:2118 start_codon:yes stop_codon:yes gene_type:complete
MNEKNRVRVGIDVGGTFTKAVALDLKSGDILGKSTVLTTHTSEKGVSEGIITALSNVMNSADITFDTIELISHSTTQAINALLESDTFKVGIIAMGVGPTKKDVIKRTDLSDPKTNSNDDLKTSHRFLDTSELISENQVKEVIQELKDDGARVIVATEAFGVDDPSNEKFVMNMATKLDLPSTASHEISGIYGLEIRTLTAAVNASVLPKTVQVANYVENAIKDFGVKAPLMIMKGDGGVTSMKTFRTKPILTILSGPAASVAGGLLHQRVTNGIFVEVGGTSTNICIIKNGKPEIRYVTINDHPTCIRSMDVRILGVAGGSMCQIKKDRIYKVGPRSAHIAGLKYSCFAEPEELEGGKIVLIKPKENDDEYVAITNKGKTFAITNTCAANAIDSIEQGDYAYANQKSARIALTILGEHLGMSFFETANSIIQTASFTIIKTISKILKEFKLSAKSTQIIGAGGGASVLVPFVSKQMEIKYLKCDNAEIISSIGVASSMLQEETEISMIEPTPEKISQECKKIHNILVDRGATPESILLNTEYISDKAILRISATGNVELDSVNTSKSVFSEQESKKRCSEILEIPESSIELTFETEHYFIFTSNIVQKKLFTKKIKTNVIILDRFGRLKLSIKNGRIFEGEETETKENVKQFLKSRHNDIAPQVHLLTDLKLIDYSGLTSNSSIINAVTQEFKESKKVAVIVEI